MDSLKAIFFDADGTLVNHYECEKHALTYLFENIGLPYLDEYQSVFRPIDHELWDTLSYNGLSVPREKIATYRFKLLFEKIGISYDDYCNANELFKVGLADSVALINGAADVVEYLHSKGYLLCVVTNGLIKLQSPRVTNSEIGKFISHIMVSEEVGAHKPNPLVFHTLLKKICLNPCDVIMIGDSINNDILGAKNAGIKSVWYNPEHMKNKADILPDYEIADLLELKSMF